MNAVVLSTNSLEFFMGVFTGAIVGFGWAYLIYLNKEGDLNEN